jgi:hypothetical protein
MMWCGLADLTRGSVARLILEREVVEREEICNRKPLARPLHPDPATPSRGREVACLPAADRHGDMS